MIELVVRWLGSLKRLNLLQIICSFPEKSEEIEKANKLHRL